ncbi:MJ0042-type zinc finger domain-containing protein [Stappia indica]|uniref:MJ0042-type zinc finger domain-containing protein n=1 Tax=Stappia indica TaxID=538381 RepID=UPI001CD77588|nr:MJ0042-type zinc finger domain-containing protein [Stappia indica]MCA1300299.1 zinc-ribbon domain-containing protein [Stappia indica]
MKITCPDCGTSYEVTAEALGSAGRSVKCTRCGSRWHADPTPAAETDAHEETDWPSELSSQEAIGPDQTAATAQEDSPSGESDSSFDPEPKTASDQAPPADMDDAFSRLADSTALDALDTFDSVPQDSGKDEETPAAPVDIETLARKPKINVKPRKRRSPVAALAGALGRRLRQIKPRRVLGAGLFAGALALCALFIAFRTPIVARMPDLAGLFALAGFEVNLRGLEFRDLRTFRELEKGTIVLVVEGTIENITQESSRVPALRFALRSEDAQEIYAWVVEPRLQRLDPGATTRFRTRLSAPPELAADIQVRFVERKQKQAKS